MTTMMMISVSLLPQPKINLNTKTQQNKDNQITSNQQATMPTCWTWVCSKRRSSKNIIHTPMSQSVALSGLRREGKSKIWSDHHLFRVGQFRMYKIETKLVNAQEPSISVYRRYRDFEWVYSMLRLRFPACIIPPIPPKSALGNWYADESEQVQKRK